MSNNNKNKSNKSKKINVATLKQVYTYISKYKFLLFLSIIFAALSVVLSLYVPILVGKAIDLIIDKGNVDFTGISKILLTMLVVIVVTGIMQWLMGIINNKISYNIVRDIRKEAFEKLQDLPISYIDKTPKGDIVSRVISDVDQFAEGLLLGFTQLFTGIVTIVVTLIFMLSIDLYIAIVVVVLTPLSLFVANFISKRTFSMFQLQSKTRGEQTALIDEMVGNVKTVQAFSYENESNKRFSEINDRLVKASQNATFFSSLTNPATRFINNIIFAAVALLGALAVLGVGISSALTVGSLSVLLSYANQYTKPFNEISGFITEFQNALASAGRVLELLAQENQTPEKEDAHVLKTPAGAVEFNNVNFSYVETKPLIKNLNIKVKPGQKIAIVGPTGCGKTTMINLLMRFYDVNSGEITVDNRDIRDITRHSLRTNFGMVLQDTWLKSGTIFENISLAKPNASLEMVIEAAKHTKAHDFIKRLPKGYDTVISEEGGALSQGQKQLLCITRVMLSLPPMLILDEATSSIDTRTEMNIQKAFNSLMEGRTSFIVAHRLSTIAQADRILVMRDGNVIEQGSHSELMNLGGFYSELYNSQFAL